MKKAIQNCALNKRQQCKHSNFNRQLLAKDSKEYEQKNSNKQCFIQDTQFSGNAAGLKFQI